MPGSQMIELVDQFGRVMSATGTRSGAKKMVDVAVGGGTIGLSGLSKLIKVTTLDIDDTAGQILLISPDPDTNSILIHNTGGGNTLYIGDSTVTADNVVGTTSGKEIQSGEEWGIDIKPGNVTIYARAPVATTIRVKITELG